MSTFNIRRIGRLKRAEHQDASKPSDGMPITIRCDPAVPTSGESTMDIYVYYSIADHPSMTTHAPLAMSLRILYCAKAFVLESYEEPQKAGESHEGAQGG